MAENTKGSEVSCPVSKICGGCVYAGLPYAEQLKKKEKRVRDLLSSLCSVRPIVGAEHPCFYRNKVHWRPTRTSLHVATKTHRNKEKIFNRQKGIKRSRCFKYY